MKTRTHLLGYPRIGEQRELKKATELYWKGKLSRAGLEAVGRNLREQNWKKQIAAGIDLVPCNDFSFYDQILDATCLFGNVPERFAWDGKAADLDTRFRIARGTHHLSTTSDHANECKNCHIATYASEMTKWFDTNYHYIVPEFKSTTEFKLSDTKIFNEYHEVKALGFDAKPTLIGPLSYLKLGKVTGGTSSNFDRMELLDRLIPVYEEILSRLGNEGASWIQLDEPILALDLTDKERTHYQRTYERLSQVSNSPKILVATYFGGLRQNLKAALDSPVAGLHFDAVRGRNELSELLAKFPSNKILSLGIVDGRNIWKNDFEDSLGILKQATSAVGEDRLWIAPSCSLLHSPVTLRNEPDLDGEIKDWLAFADEKMIEVDTLRNLLTGESDLNVLQANQESRERRNTSTKIRDLGVQARLKAITPGDSIRTSPFANRQSLQHEKLKLPLYPTTTIGSFPQTKDIRSARAKWKKGIMSNAEYDAFLKKETEHCVQFQNRIGIDMPVHGEFERNDMVEYFGEQLEGFLFTENGWVQSYGSRCVKPPIIYGDVSRPNPMTIYWSKFAQTLTQRPMKGMLTGPVTILQWSFARNDQPRDVTARQIALAIRDEVIDLEKIGIAAIQIDEPAFREGLPLREEDWPTYLAWAVDAFRLCSSGVRDDTQIHTHMCYSEFNDIIEAIAAMDADVITIETSRSNMELLDAFVDFDYPNEIGPGVYDIHSPRVPTTEEMEKLMEKAEAVLQRRNLWVNPDCGLKTRSWEEVEPSLINMVDAARNLREKATKPELCERA
ncbi:5-methyltetrahydropteroyltriglutamate--homocysteine S-methyltransferase [Luteolibacter pohnpeiensis]|uniref:5-methyltetrahydropteroyltriglutamate--homocysteine methyltransferase n=1 Tax=Luteolibacter pohnpeiensis TaxID=454153 RepID=A0A934S7U7_9BACT|nr:5-methyltetrahydropteroyltriglutamate--homocysteine S-methyltransferase [Luteolibacter pohnpeiensis]MBK1880959.1 5-methyltetrahydropteroyltriglutamate--homocysteine S-methyltransferase [Luteolibacter pohnpeiensis]